MAKLKPNDEPTAKIPVDLHENLVRQTLRMNPGLAPNMDAKEFIQNQSGEFEAAKQRKDPKASDDGPRASVAVRTMAAYVKQERQKLGHVIGDIKRKKEALDKEAATARRLASSALVRFLATNARNEEDLKAVVGQHQTFLQELAISERDLVKRTLELMEKLGK